MDPNDVLKGLKTKTIGRPLYCFESVGSTNDVALELAQAGAQEGTAVCAEAQTKGRGRQGRRWALAPGKALALSLVLRPKLRLDEVPEITLAAAVAAARTLASYGTRPEIKWPNDILLSGRKVCGILTEMGGKEDRMTPVVLGLGVNLNQGTRDFPVELRKTAVGLAQVLGRRVDRVRFLRRLLLEVETTYGWVSERKFSRVLAEWRKNCKVLGKQVKVQQGHHVLYGQALDVDEKGALLVRNDHGMVERVLSGDVTPLNI